MSGESATYTVRWYHQRDKCWRTARFYGDSGKQLLDAAMHHFVEDGVPHDQPVILYGPQPSLGEILHRRIGDQAEALDRGHEPDAITFNGISVKVVNPILSFRDGDWHEPR